MFPQQVGLKISQKKTEIMILNVSNTSSVQVKVDLPTTKEFTYLGSTVRYDGRADNNFRNHLNKAQGSKLMLTNLQNASEKNIYYQTFAS